MEGLVDAVVKWEKEHWVPYLWRVDRIPYKVLAAEVLLQRTTFCNSNLKYTERIKKLDRKLICTRGQALTEEDFHLLTPLVEWVFYWLLVCKLSFIKGAVCLSAAR